MSITNIIFKIVAYFVFIAFALSVFAIFSPFITQYFGFSLIEFLSPADARPDLAFPFYVLFTGISYVFDRDIFVVFFNSIVTFYMTIVAFEIYDVVVRKQQVVVSDKSS